MNRFVSRKSILVLVLAWVVTLTLFADGANLDDLCSGTIVLHDDDEVGAAADMNSAAQVDQGIPPNHAPLPPSHDAKNDSHQVPAAPIRVIVDQDSPFLEAESRLGTLFESFDATNTNIVVHQNPQGREALHLQFCSLLI